MLTVLLKGFGFFTMNQLIIMPEVHLSNTDHMIESEIVDEFSGLVTRNNMLTNVGDFIAIENHGPVQVSTSHVCVYTWPNIGTVHGMYVTSDSYMYGMCW